MTLFTKTKILTLIHDKNSWRQKDNYAWTSSLWKKKYEKR